MFILTESKRNLIIVISLMIGFIFVPTTTQAQPFKPFGKIPNYCSATPLALAKHTYGSIRIFKNGAMTMELKAELLRSFFKHQGTGGGEVAHKTHKFISIDMFSILQSGKHFSLGVSDRYHLMTWEKTLSIFRRMYATRNVYAKRDMNTFNFNKQLEELPRGDHIYVGFVDTKTSKDYHTISHRMVMVKDKEGDIRILSTRAGNEPHEMFGFFEGNVYNSGDFFSNPDVYNKIFYSEGKGKRPNIYPTENEIFKNYEFNIIGIRRKVTEVETIGPDEQGGAGPGP